MLQSSDLRFIFSFLILSKISILTTMIIIPTNIHPMQTPSKSGIISHKVCPSLLLSHCELKVVKQSLKYGNWSTTM